MPVRAPEILVARLISVANRRAIAYAEADRSVTHLVLARRLVKRTHRISNRKELGARSHCQFPPARFFLVSCSHIRRAGFGKHALSNLVPIPPLAGPENVQFRSVFIQIVKSFGYVGCRLRSPRSNLLLTHGTVESPAKVSLSSLHGVKQRSAAASNQRKGLTPTSGSGWRPRS